MDGDLLSLLQANGVTEDVVKTLTGAKCVKIGLIAHWFENGTELKEFLATIPSAKDDPAQRASLKFCVAKAVELSARQIKKGCTRPGRRTVR